MPDFTKMTRAEKTAYFAYREINPQTPKAELVEPEDTIFNGLEDCLSVVMLDVDNPLFLGHNGTIQFILNTSGTAVYSYPLSQGGKPGFFGTVKHFARVAIRSNASDINASELGEKVIADNSGPASQYVRASEKGRVAEQTVKGVVRGGYAFRGQFFYHGSTTVGIQVVDLAEGVEYL